MTFHAVALLSQLREDRGMRVQAGSANVVLVREGEHVHAFQADCPHAGGPLDEGAVCDGLLICPWHKAAFAIDTGETCEPPALASLKRYPVRTEGDMLWVGDQPVPARHPPAPHDGRCFIVVGAGAAGTAAVAALRANGYAGQLIWIDREQPNAYDRTALSKFVIAAQMPPAQVPTLLERDFHRGAHVQHVQGTLRLLDSRSRTLHLLDGRQFSYDAALVATGGVPQRPALEGANLPGVLVLRSLADAEQLLDAAEPGTPVVIIGDSFIGLEAASALRKAGLQVHVVGRHEVPLRKQLGERIGRAVRRLHEHHGVVFHAATEPSRLEGDSHVQAVVLKNGQRIDTHLVLLATGIAPATHWANDLPLAEDRSLHVDAGMAVTKHLWAAGDMVTFPFEGRPVRIEHWRVAQQQARVAAANMLGAAHKFEDVPFFWTYHYGKTIEVLGHASAWNRIDCFGEPEGFSFIALLCVDEQVEAVVACEHQRVMAGLSQRMKRPLSREQALAYLQRLS